MVAAGLAFALQKVVTALAEQILLEVTRKHTVKIAEMSDGALKELEKRYVLESSELEPCVYWRRTDNWLELTVRFI